MKGISEKNEIDSESIKLKTVEPTTSWYESE